MNKLANRPRTALAVLCGKASIISDVGLFSARNLRKVSISSMVHGDRVAAGADEQENAARLMPIRCKVALVVQRSQHAPTNFWAEHAKRMLPVMLYYKMSVFAFPVLG